MDSTKSLSYMRFLAFAALGVGVALALLLIWRLAFVLVMAYAAILAAILLHVASEPLQRWTPLPRWVDLIIAALVTLALVGLAGWLFGSRISSEFSQVADRVQAGLAELQKLMSASQTGQFVLARLKSADISVTGIFGALVSTMIGAAEAAVVILISAAYLAGQPELYCAGVVLLFPASSQDWANETLRDLGVALRYWLIGQLLQMAIVGLLSTLAVWGIGLPSPWALGLIAALAEFIPYLGPILAAIPALLVALTQDPHAVIWTLGAYLLIHQVEGNLVVPLVQRRMIYIPPALMLLGIAAIGALLGPIGFVIAAPVVVAVFVVVKKVYVRETLKQPVVLPGESERDARASGLAA